MNYQIEQSEKKIVEYEIAIPKPSALVESLRAVGYDFKTAMADIIDNCVTANAKNINIDFTWAGEESTVSIHDDGHGMDKLELVEAMTLGSTSPKDIRQENDLGRYGLGLKTASFSQCRLLEVVSKKQNNEIAARKWDLDYISETGEWRLLEISKDNISIAQLIRENGTIVIWKKLDRLTAGTKVESIKDRDNFFQQFDELKGHLSMVFHRYMTDINGINIYVNSRKLKAWDPFLTREPATQILAEEILLINKTHLKVKPYVLPHHLKLSTETHSSGSGFDGWNAHQGFYVYRNKRLLVPGDWLGLGFQKEEHYKLARIQIDLPNTMDDMWQIDIKKSKATPPAELRKDLRRIAQLTRKNASEVYRHRGKMLTRKVSDQLNFVWKRGEINNHVVYRINRDNPAIEKLIENIEQKKSLFALLKLVEQTIPAAGVVADWNESPMDKPSAKYDESRRKELTLLAEEMMTILTTKGKTRDQAIQILSTIEPFDEYPEILVSGVLA